MMKICILITFWLLAFLECKKEVTLASKNPEIAQSEIILNRVPLFERLPDNTQFTVRFTVNAPYQKLSLKGIVLSFAETSNFTGIAQVEISYTNTINGSTPESSFGSVIPTSNLLIINGLKELSTGIHFFNFKLKLKSNPNLITNLQLNNIKLSFTNHADLSLSPAEKFTFRPALVVRSAGQDQVNTYRIPGLVTTQKGTLIAVYDNRYNSSKDLQEDIDIGMSRSTDGGATWQSMKVIMDMGEYGGRPQNLNGTGDPCILFDPQTNTLWVAALWMSGASNTQMLWNASKPGLNPEETGQFMLVKSTDDGLTWSRPINITNQIKEPAWQLLLQGPGRGITMKDGTLVFPAQFKADLGVKAIDGGQYTCNSSIVYSKDGGNTWQTGTGAKSNTTESQVVELSNGKLMLNMRDDRNRSDKSETNGRAVSITSDLGKTWTIYPSSNGALQEPNCMASLISADLSVNGRVQQVLFFSNPDSKTDRNHMTIKASLDGGLTWPQQYQTELNSETGYGYSCLTMVDDHTIGILYEGVKELYFQKIAVTDILGSSFTK